MNREQTKHDGGPAFPVRGFTVDANGALCGETVQSAGMSLRAYLVAHAPAEPQPWFEPVMPDDGDGYANEYDLQRHLQWPLAWADMQIARMQATQPKTLQKSCSVSLTFKDDMPAAGAYLCGSASEGNAQVALNAKLALKAAKTVGVTTKEQADQFRRFLAEGLAHELLHACQDLFGVAFNETDIEAALAKINGDDCRWMDDNAETREQVIQQMTRDQVEMSEQIERLGKQRDELLAACSLFIHAEHPDHFSSRLSESEMEGVEAIHSAVAKVKAGDANEQIIHQMARDQVECRRAIERLGREKDELMVALEASVRLQSQYARLLNMHDGGTRMMFESACDWIDRIKQTRPVSVDDSAASEQELPKFPCEIQLGRFYWKFKEDGGVRDVYDGNRDVRVVPGHGFIGQQLALLALRCGGRVVEEGGAA